MLSNLMERYVPVVILHYKCIRMITSSIINERFSSNRITFKDQTGSVSKGLKENADR